MIEEFIYFTIAASIQWSGISFWRAIFWPTIVGQLIAKAAMQEDV